MPTALQQRQKRETKRLQKLAIKLHSTALSVGHSATLPSPPDFGAPKFTEAEQLANPGKPMTRRIKDFIRVGEWKEGFDVAGQPVFGQYDRAELQIILNNALGLMANGDSINLGKSHGDEQMIIPTDELMSPVDEVRPSADGEVLWFSTYVTPEQAKYLDNPAIKVSAGMFPDYTAGNGKLFKGRTLLHIAATDRPVVGGQGPFIALSNYVTVAEIKPAAVTTPEAKPAPVVPVQQATKPTVKPAVHAKPVPKFAQRLGDRIRRRVFKKPVRKVIRFGNDVMSRAIALASTLGQGTGNMDIAALLAAINALFKAFGLGQLPDGTDETNLIPRLEGVALAIGGEVDDGAAAVDAGADGAGAGAGGIAAAGAGMPVGMANLLKSVDARISKANAPLLEAIGTLTKAVGAKAGEVVDQKKANWILFRNALLAKGVPEATLAAKDELGKLTEWNTEILEGIVPTIKMSNLVSSAAATVDPPATSGVLTDEQVAARIKARGGNPANMPKSTV